MVSATASAGSDDVFSPEVRVALAPGATYRRLLTSEAHVRGWRLFRRPAMVLLVIGTLVPIMAVQRVTLGLMATAAVSWSFIVAIQILVGVAVIASAPARRVSMLRALDLWFAGHLPYSLWLLIAFAWMGSSSSGPLRLLVVSAVVPAAWTARIVFAFCRTVLVTTPTGARWRVVAHFAGVWAIGLTYVAWSAGGWFQLLP
jgi:hypothetical protein